VRVHTLLHNLQLALHDCNPQYDEKFKASHSSFPFALDLACLPGTSRDVYQSIAKVLPVTHLSHSIFDVSSLPKWWASNEDLRRYYVGVFVFFWSHYLADTDAAKGLWRDDTMSIHRRLAPRTGPSPPRRHNFFDFLHFRQPVDGSPSIPLYARRWNVSSPTRRVSMHAVDVTPARDEDVSRSPLMSPVMPIS
jgi:hypothetical protein